MLKKILRKIHLKGKKFLADRLYDVMWLRGYLEERGIRSLIRVRRNGVGRGDISLDEYKERNEIEEMFGVIKTKLGGYVMAYREGIAKVLALVRFLSWNMYVALFSRLSPTVFCSLFGLAGYYYLPLSQIFNYSLLLSLRGLFVIQ